MMKSKPITSKRLKPVFMWAIKHRRANFKIAHDYYPSKKSALKDFETIPPFYKMDKHLFCQDCGVGCRDEYEIVKVQVIQIN